MANNINYGPDPRSKVYDVTLLALSWLGASSPYTYIISTITSINSNAIVHIIPSPNITSTEYTAYINAKIIDGGVNPSNYVTLKAVGTKPAVNIPVRIIVSESIFVESKYELNTFPTSSTLEAGLIAIATDAEVKLGINNTKAVTSLTLSNNYLKKTGGTLTGALTGTTITANTMICTTANITSSATCPTINVTTINGNIIKGTTYTGTTFTGTTFNGTLNGSATKLSTNRTNYVTNETTENVVGQLAWQNYGSNHTIFDASKGISPSGTAVNNTNPAVVWSATHPTLMGWNGSATYGVRTYISNTTDAIATVPVYTGTTNPTSATRVNINGYVYATRMYNAVFNDYAECFDNKELTYTEAKNKIVELDENNNTVLAKENSNMIIGVVSDSFGHMLGGTEEEIQEGSKMPIGLAGVLYVDSLDRVDIKNRGKFITSGGNGLAKVLDTPVLGSIVGKIIDIDEVNNRYKVIITLM